ncbi:hypothetical protein LTR56_001905 [Elasticomyces elasticus]|nr:hypothetical protein LTR56_001905 [Elasticomyces elasticus]KAK3668744.1 hypothetical protein LTR22_000224 [Elasticomyces elasticus]KAK4930584.1 hypothetical protein LTR49_002998 [Elasticomyces elasticus]KAK5757903.1 hypothetical protein LTS12_011942 [Elasticomyces elasticus]
MEGQGRLLDLATMKCTLLTALPLASAAALPVLVPRQNYFSFGNAFSTGPVAANSFIGQSTTTLVLPDLQSPHNGNLGLWPGVGTKFTDSDQDGQLVQGPAISTVGQGLDLQLFLALSSLTIEQISLKLRCQRREVVLNGVIHGKTIGANPDDHVTYDYKYNDATKEIDQTVSVNGAIVSTLSTTSGVGAGWGTAMECQQDKCGTVPEHHYINTTLIMDIADPDYNQTWTVADIKIDQYTYT